MSDDDYQWRYVGSFRSPYGFVSIGDPCGSVPSDATWERLIYPDGIKPAWEDLDRRDPPRILDANYELNELGEPWPGAGLLTSNCVGDGVFRVSREGDDTLTIHYEDAGNAEPLERYENAFVVDSGLTWVGASNGLDVQVFLNGGDTLRCWVYADASWNVQKVRVSTKEAL